MYINNALVKKNAELRREARMQLKGRWGMAILLCLISNIIAAVCGMIPYLGPAALIVISGPLSLGLAGCFLKLVRGEEVQLENIFDGFKNFPKALVLALLISVFTFLWSLLFVVPGIVAAFRYSMAYYILCDNPGISAKEALDISKRMMLGYKGKLFLLYLSFIGWSLLCLLTFGIGSLWLTPYVNTAVANFYQNLKEATVPDAGPKAAQDQ